MWHFKRKILVCLGILSLGQEAYALPTCKEVLALTADGNAFHSLPYILGIRDLKLKDLDPRFEFRAIRKLGQEILERFPPSQYYYLGIGRSPFAFIDFFNLVSPGSATTFPISYNKYTFAKYLPRSLIPMTTLRKVSVEPYSWERRHYYVDIPRENRKPPLYMQIEKRWRHIPGLRNVVFQGFDQFFPAPSAIENRTILLLDFSDYGESLAKFYADTQAYLVERNRHHSVEILFLDQRGFDDDPNWKGGEWFRARLLEYGHPEARFVSINIFKNHPEIQRLFDGEGMKPYSPYRHFVLKDGSRLFRPKSRQTMHGMFLKALASEFEASYFSDPLFRAQIEQIRVPK